MPKPKFFPSPSEFRDWLLENHESETELLVGFFKTSSGKPSMTWSQSVDEALCFGWIDAVRRSLSEEAYTIRFTRRKPKSIWSAINVAKVEQLTAQGKMYPAGERAFAARSPERTGVYSFERKQPAQLAAAEDQTFRRNKRAWGFFESQAPSYRRAALHWVISAKRPETRSRRLDALIADSAAAKRLDHLTPRPGKARKPSGAPNTAGARKPARAPSKSSPTRSTRKSSR